MLGAIQVDGLAKRYVLSHETAEQYVALRDVMADAVRRLFRGRPKIARPEAEEFWALDGVSFRVAPGDRVGIIGRNGAGKSTLLKILSRITEPTRGRVETHGRIASLLEVGTGFHPELTGRENIFLNGAILGMSKREITAKFDEIVAFAEIERFLDTPVKRYSSGMYVRLAFAVAAYIDPDILVVDEVLAVGDTRFQKKCLGKMSERAGAGKTILFVSHNLAAVRSLTNRVIVVERGRIAFDGSTEEGIAHYVASTADAHEASKAEFAGRGVHTKIHSARIVGDGGAATLEVDPGGSIQIEVDLTTDGGTNLSLEAFLYDGSKIPLGLFSMYQFHGRTLPERAGRFICRFAIKPPHLASGSYSFDLATSVANVDWDHYVSDALAFDIHASNPGGLPWDFRQQAGYGSLALACDGPIEIQDARPRPRG
jgi:lipopolysaccharide transport system ATP-binding protein